MENFAATRRHSKLLEPSASGELENKKYHAQLLQTDELGRTAQLFLFQVDPNAGYILTNQSGKFEDLGGSGSWRVREINFNNSSLYVTFGYHWHNCEGQFSSQFQFRNGQFVMVGKEAWEDNPDEDVEASSSGNILTSKAFTVVVRGKRKAENFHRGKPSSKTYEFEHIGRTPAFSEFDGTP